MKVKGKLEFIDDKNLKFSVRLDVVDKNDNILKKGNLYPNTKIKNGFTINTNFSSLLVSCQFNLLKEEVFDRYFNEDQYEIFYKSEYIKI